MPIIQTKIVKSRYSRRHFILNEKINVGQDGKKIKNILMNKEFISVKNITRNAFFLNIDLNIESIITVVVEENGLCEKYTLTNQFIRPIKVFRKFFNPKVFSCDFNEYECIIKFKKPNFLYDIDIDYKEISIYGECLIDIRLLQERCVDVGEIKNFEVFKQVALSLDDMDIKDVITNLDGIVKTLSNRLSEIEEENRYLKSEIERYKLEVDTLIKEQSSEKIKNMDLTSECNRLIEKIKELEERLEKERKKSTILEIENLRAQDEIKRLKKEKIEITNELEKEKIPLSQKIREYFKK